MQFFRWSLHTCFKNQTVNITFESELPTELTDVNQYSLMLTVLQEYINLSSALQISIHC